MPQSNKWLRHVILLSNVPGKETTPSDIVRHVQFLSELEERDQLEVCGPFVDKSGGMIILKNVTREEAEGIAARDPFVASGTRTTVIRSFEKSCWENNHLGRLNDE